MVLEARGIDVRLVLETSKSHLIGLEQNVFHKRVGQTHPTLLHHSTNMSV